MKIGIVGSGISGISAAYLLSKDEENEVIVFEANSYAGGHTNTQYISSLYDEKTTIGVDTGFIVCNPETYPNFLALMQELEVELIQSDMSFSVSRNGGSFEWCGDNLNTLFAQRSNLLPRSSGDNIYRMIFDILRFHREALELASEADSHELDESDDNDNNNNLNPNWTLGNWFKARGYSAFFYENYILPMTASIWSSPAELTFDKFPIITLVRFMRNHCLLQIGNRPKWRTVNQGSQSYVAKALSKSTVLLNTRITGVKRPESEGEGEKKKIHLTDEKGQCHEFDHVIFATHSDQTLRILGSAATDAERAILGAIKFNKNRAVLHRDASLMPKRKLAWASWNYLTSSKMECKSSSMCLTYWMNRLQPFIDPEKFGQVFVTMNPLFEPSKDLTLGEFHYEHPIYSPETIAAQEKLNSIQNKHRTSFAGAWTNYGFHEDGATSGLLAAISLGAKCSFPVVLNGGHPTSRVPPAPPAWLKDRVQPYKPPSPTPSQRRLSVKSNPVNGLLSLAFAFGFGLLAFIFTLLIK